MTPKLPPLPALRAFAVAARHLSFKAAAAELHVTPGAISQQIKSLEQALGMLLFVRRNRRLALSAAGAAYLPSIRAAFDEIAGATSRLTRVQRPLTVSVPPSFATHWLLPRLERFRRLHPALELAIDATMGLANFDGDEIDIAVRYGRGRYAGLRSDRLFAVRLVPVCSPRLLKGRTARARMAALRGLPLLHDKARRNWRPWLDAQGLGDVDATRGPSFSDQTFMLQAALLGQGIALAPDALVADEIAQGRLVVLSDAAWPTQSAYYCVASAARYDDRNVALFRNWLFAEARQAMMAST
jgi:LysR family glycine cleavage system transcriptional activator